LNIASKDEFEKMANLGVQPWAGACIKDEAGVDMAIECGATLITCNNPGEILALLRAKGYHG
jgi:glycerophosphoryl diester phosphodiesterase